MSRSPLPPPKKSRKGSSRSARGWKQMQVCVLLPQAASSMTGCTAPVLGGQGPQPPPSTSPCPTRGPCARQRRRAGGRAGGRGTRRALSAFVSCPPAWCPCSEMVGSDRFPAQWARGGTNPGASTFHGVTPPVLARWA